VGGTTPANGAQRQGGRPASRRWTSEAGRGTPTQLRASLRRPSALMTHWRAGTLGDPPPSPRWCLRTYSHFKASAKKWIESCSYSTAEGVISVSVHNHGVGYICFCTKPWGWLCMPLYKITGSVYYVPVQITGSVIYVSVQNQGFGHICFCTKFRVRFVGIVSAMLRLVYILQHNRHVRRHGSASLCHGLSPSAIAVSH
jgi:hypothetical protein